eukprot:gb/GECG01012967.1/.p1 GENE.gb/GECG01012967.1/~~gb/GECG01012967.1/.p1  ORF type:complete len:386 (+),score=57.24 gb/GECG01012967.1/:1-1158(+)
MMLWRPFTRSTRVRGGMELGERVCMPIASSQLCSTASREAVRRYSQQSQQEQQRKRTWVSTVQERLPGWTRSAFRELAILAALAIITAAVVSGRKVSKQVVPKDVYELCRRAHEARTDNNIKKAVLLYKQALDRLESRRGDLFHLFEVNFRLGLCYEDIKDWKQAMAFFDKACKLCDQMEKEMEQDRLERQQTRVLHAVALSHLAECKETTGGKHRALTDLGTSIKLLLSEHPDLEGQMKRQKPNQQDYSHAKNSNIAEQFARVSLAGILHNRARIYEDINRRNEAVNDAQYALHLITDAVNWASKNKYKKRETLPQGKYSAFATDVAKQMSEAAGGIFSGNEAENENKTPKSQRRYRVYEFSHVDELMSMRNHTRRFLDTLKKD